MKKSIVLFILGMAVLCGCRQVETRNINRSVIGVWQTQDERPWRFIFAEKGAIKKVFRDDTLIMDIAAGGATVGKPDDEIFANYVYGPCVWSYDPQAGILRVTVTIENFYVKAGDATLDCFLMDKFEGPLSEDRQTWMASWTTITKWNDGAPDQIITDRTLIFHKIK